MHRLVNQQIARLATALKVEDNKGRGGDGKVRPYSKHDAGRIMEAILVLSEKLRTQRNISEVSNSNN